MIPNSRRTRVIVLHLWISLYLALSTWGFDKEWRITGDEGAWSPIVVPNSLGGDRVREEVRRLTNNGDKVVRCQVEIATALEEEEGTGIKAEAAAEMARKASVPLEERLAAFGPDADIKIDAHDGAWGYEVHFGNRILQRNGNEGTVVGNFVEIDETGRHVYRGGEICTDEISRSAMVEFVCATEGNGRPRVVRASEPAMCEYEFTVACQEVCGDPRFGSEEKARSPAVEYLLELFYSPYGQAVCQLTLNSRLPPEAAPYAIQMQLTGADLVSAADAHSPLIVVRDVYRKSVSDTPYGLVNGSLIVGHARTETIGFIQWIQ